MLAAKLELWCLFVTSNLGVKKYYLLTWGNSAGVLPKYFSSKWLGYLISNKKEPNKWKQKIIITNYGREPKLCEPKQVVRQVWIGEWVDDLKSLFTNEVEDKWIEVSPCWERIIVSGLGPFSSTQK